MAYKKDTRSIASFAGGLLLLAALVAAPAEAQQSQPDAKFTDINLIGLMVNNNGFLGTNLPNGQSPPSFEYP
ncbi:MAG: hypothetical protein HKN20_10880, partial [Gemmatimonadetes bacterium]|nr:hypothetical protein [Gemmatimonadota bacterium]